MSVLTKDDLLQAVSEGRIQIEPFSEDMEGPGSVDLSLSDEFRIFKKLRKAVAVEDSLELEKITRLVYRSSFTLLPGETILGITREKIRLAPNLCGWIQGRSRFARVGLLVHMTASFIQPGINNRQVLEISNMAPFPLILRPDTRICQIVFQTTIGKAVYHGRHMYQERL
jgi:dCTP deaminase